MENNITSSFCSQGTDPYILHNKAISPTWVTTSPIPRSPALQVFVRVLRRFKWVNICLVYDSSSSSGYTLVRDFLLTALRANNLHVTSISLNSKISPDFTNELGIFRRNSRGTMNRQLISIFFCLRHLNYFSQCS